MICKNCNAQNEDTARFCRRCGAPIAEQESYQAEPKKKSKAGILAAIGVILIAIIIAGVFMMRTNQVKKQEQYNQYVAEGDKYLEELDYDKAEESYLSAINVAPKEEEPYLSLADLYVSQEDYDKAIAILEQAEKNTSKESIAVKDKKDQIKEQKAEAEAGPGYSWVLEPEIEADEIYYLREINAWQKCDNITQKQLVGDYAVIRKGDAYGLVDDTGNWYQNMECSNVRVVWGKYAFTTKTAVYSAEFNANIDNFYVDENGEMKEFLARGLDVYGSQGEYYYCDSLHNTAERYMADLDEQWELKPLMEAAPVRKMARMFDGDSGITAWDEQEQYAVWKDNEAVTDFAYDECGSLESGLLAAKRDGKWGYVNDNGEVVIPFEYNASWKHYNPSSYSDLDETEYCYAATEGYVPLMKEGKWEMRNTENKVVIASGTFEEILPVHNDRCWVKKDGKWGVIEFEKAVKDADADKGNKEPKEEVDKNETTDSNADANALIRKIARTWTNEGNAWSNTYTTTFNADGTVTSEGWRIKMQESMRW